MTDTPLPPPVSVLLRLHLSQLRNLRDVRLNPLSRINILYGANGSGKTSVLEGIHILGRGRSFRRSPPRLLVRHGEKQLTVFGVQRDHPGTSPVNVGVQRSVTGELDIRIGGMSQRNLSALAQLLPVQVINADSFDLLVGSPGVRRQFLNWGVFHVEQGFHTQWQRFQRCIKQRNTLLRRDNMADSELAVWDREVADSGEAINAFRIKYFEALAPCFREVVTSLVPGIDQVELRYRRGWDKSLPYLEALAAARLSDRERGFTQSGPHRADLRMTVGGHSAADTLSRGQQKLVVVALKLAQGRLLHDSTGRHCVYLIDDLPSELDREHALRVCEALNRLGAQVFITCVDPGELQAIWPGGGDAPAMFHVEQGQVTITPFDDECEN